MLTSKNVTRGRPRGGTADKRQAILAGALTVFARDGYTRASIDGIAGEAAVSTRTIYNHFKDKAELFHSVIQTSTARIAEAHLDLIDRHLGKITDLEADLVAFGLAWTVAGTDSEHSALVRQINAEAGHLPAEAVTAWQEAGPLRVRRALGDRLAELGQLRVADPEQAALHYSLLISGANPSMPGAPRTDEEREAAVAAGVHAFLYGYSARDEALAP
ncbi:TetR/AcrR family transcriptional regulator [Streptomyces monticola]|uniref:TetR/AcrR family transcriptional regulator n=1 Tax=Streptomyces monticola TaxID=2666263 RepID=A0ABW2JSE5_9ACTN